MKNWTLKSVVAAVVMMACINGSAQITFFEKYHGSKTAIYVYLNKTMIQAVGTKNFSTDQEVNDVLNGIIQKVNTMQVLESKDSLTITQMNADFANEVKEKNYELIMKSNDEDGKLTLYSRETKKETYLLIEAIKEESTNIIGMAIDGKLSAKELARLVDLEDRKVETLNIEH